MLNTGITVFDRSICLVANKDLEGLVAALAENTHSSVFFCNVHMLVLSQEDQNLASAMGNADHLFADGVAITGGFYCHSEYLGSRIKDVKSFDWKKMEVASVVEDTKYPKSKV